MRFSKTAIIFLVSAILLSIFVAKISNVITVNVEVRKGSEERFISRNLQDDINDVDGRNWNRQHQNTLNIGASAQHLIWFVQISDIHISIFHDPTRVSDLREFCDVNLNAIKPSVVLASGDLTDAKSENNMGSRQYVEEWEFYKDVLDQCKVTEKTLWLDIRGNHDNFNVPSLDSKENYYRNYSIQGRKHLRSYMFQLKQGSETYSFIAVDACLDPGPRRPFNFIGVLSKWEYELLESFEKKAQKGNYTIWFGHYPTSCILAPNPGIRTLMGRGLVYLCGHFHTLGGLVPNMYTMQQTGNLELELGDWKDNRIYRVLAIDHGVLSFVDVGHREWPVILVTNPKHALYVMPTKEPVDEILASTHIRTERYQYFTMSTDLAFLEFWEFYLNFWHQKLCMNYLHSFKNGHMILTFSLSKIASVQFRIDEGGWQHCSHVEGPLYVHPWRPKEYATGLHTIEVFVKDELGRTKRISDPFSLDGTRLSFRLLPRIALMSNVSMVFQFMFGIMLIICIVPLAVLRYLHKLTRRNQLHKPRKTFPFFHAWLRKLWILSTVDRIFFPMTLYALYLTIGPWSVGEIIEGHTGIIFAWGTVVGGSYLPGSFTYAYGFFQFKQGWWQWPPKLIEQTRNSFAETMFTFHLPLTLFLAHCVDCRFHLCYGRKRSSLCRYILRHLPFLIIVSLQMVFAYFFWLAYGTMAFLLGPLRTWSVVLGVFLWYQAITLPEKCMREAAFVWNLGPTVVNAYESEGGGNALVTAATST